ncbi:hypothetical protein KZZ07_26380 [Mameliella sp. CS4]|uniref:hypothetical protein n=1 Tax=Mameliella sp. CS4 TaxID=2862329 RepID=UPI001C5E8BFA|nr:hypothetical protein [Mameliella sp. CS4]MBW4986058.1 hypothetical protein [Mameliella sp. CS4]
MSGAAGCFRTNPFPTRADDERVLSILDVISHESVKAARERFGLTHSAVQGMRTRFLNPKYQPEDRCRRKKNQDGGMPRHWWAS